MGWGWNGSCDVILTKNGPGPLWIPRLLKGCQRTWGHASLSCWSSVQERTVTAVASLWPWGLHCLYLRGKQVSLGQCWLSAVRSKQRLHQGLHIPSSSRGANLQACGGGGFPNHVLRIPEFKPSPYFKCHFPGSPLRAEWQLSFSVITTITSVSLAISKGTLIVC